MARYRNVSTSFWTDSRVVDDFTPEDKYIYLYCMTNPHTNLCGCYEVSIKQMADETGYNRDTIERLLRRLDGTHNVLRYSAATKELLILNWDRYNWSKSEKLDKPLLLEISSVKCDGFRKFLAEKYNRRETVQVPYDYQCDDNIPESVFPCKEDEPPTVLPPNKVRHKYGEYGWVKLTDEEYARLNRDLGLNELERCITYIDESAQTTGNKNKWKDWDLVIRKCSRNGWGLNGRNVTRRPAKDAMDDLMELHQYFSEEG